MRSEARVGDRAHACLDHDVDRALGARLAQLADHDARRSPRGRAARFLSSVRVTRDSRSRSSISSPMRCAPRANALEVDRGRSASSCAVVVLDERLAEAVDRAQRRAQVVRDRVAERLELLVRGLGGARLALRLDERTLRTLRLAIRFLAVGAEPLGGAVRLAREVADLVADRNLDRSREVAAGEPLDALGHRAQRPHGAPDQPPRQAAPSARALRSRRRCRSSAIRPARRARSRTRRSAGSWSGRTAVSSLARNASRLRRIVSIAAPSCAIGWPWMIEAETPRAICVVRLERGDELRRIGAVRGDRVLARFEAPQELGLQPVGLVELRFFRRAGRILERARSGPRPCA